MSFQRPLTVMPMRQFIGSQNDVRPRSTSSQVLPGAEETLSSEENSLIEEPSGVGRTTSVGLVSEGFILRKQLKFFFMNPWEKWTARRQFPWKLFLQVLKIVLVTVELVLFGQLRLNHILFLEQTEVVLRHRFLENWSETRDVGVYPPPSGPYSVYSTDDFFDKIAFAVGEFYLINSTSLNAFQYDHNLDNFPPLKFCLEQYRMYDSDKTHIDNTYTVCTKINLTVAERNELDRNGSYFIEKYFGDRNITLDARRFVNAWISFNLRTLRLNSHLPRKNDPDCYLLNISILFDNSYHTGRVPVVLKAHADFLDNCTFLPGYIASNVNGVMKVFTQILDPVVLVLCVSSLILCGRALFRAYVLSNRTANYFRNGLGESLSLSDKMEFVNIWYILIVLNDCLILLGTIFKWSIEFTKFDSTLFSAAGILLGSGILLVWTGVLRYLGFFPHYNVLILTMKKSMPNVIRFMLCAAILYCGFLFCGWIVLAPYSLKFRDLLRTSETLFALINGDDMFATFYTISDDSPAAKWFGRFYLYVFIGLFIYIVLSLFISIIMDAYEVIKERYEQKETVSKLKQFVSECVETPSSGNFDSTDPLADCSTCPDCLRLLISKATGRNTRTRSDYSEIGSSAN